MSHEPSAMSRGATRAARVAGLCILSVTLMVAVAMPASGAAVGQREVLPSGMVLLTAERTSVPIVTVNVLLQAGAYLDPADKGGVAGITADLITRGTTTRTATQLKESI
jgi:predicted Zn-dependent peptidase